MIPVITPLIAVLLPVFVLYRCYKERPVKKAYLYSVGSFTAALAAVCIEVRTDMGIEELCAALDEIKLNGADKYSFRIPDNCEISGKYNDFIPRELLKKQYIEDYLDTEDMRINMEGGDMPLLK